MHCTNCLRRFDFLQICGHAFSPAQRISATARPRFGVADDAPDGRKTVAQTAFNGVDEFMRGAHRDRRIEPAMEIDDLAVGGLAHAHVVHLAAVGESRGERREPAPAAAATATSAIARSPSHSAR